MNFNWKKTLVIEFYLIFLRLTIFKAICIVGYLMLAQPSLGELSYFFCRKYIKISIMRLDYAKSNENQYQRPIFNIILRITKEKNNTMKIKKYQILF